MEHDNQTKTRIEITQDKLIDILLHAATREDLATLAADTKAEFVKVDAKFDKIDAKFDRIDVKFDKLNAKIDKLIYLVLATLIVPTALHFLLK